MSKVLKRGTAMLAVLMASRGVRHDRAGADANIALEEGRTIPGGR